ncbi:hypothetical protein RAD16_05180 [Bradyrhizobium sp. 18BD]
MSSASDVAYEAARRAYAAAGHAGGGMLQIVPVSGREAPNVIALSERRRKRDAEETGK